MIIKQRTTAIDPLLFDVICPFLRATGLDRVIPIARLWKRLVVPAPVPILVPVRAFVEPLLSIESGGAA